MAEGKTKVTLVGDVLAREGTEFIYEGEVAGCQSCRIRKACNNLQKGRRYRIVSVRTTHHECPVHLNGATAVEVADATVAALVNADMAIVNSKITFDGSCTRNECRSYPLCRPDGIIDGEKYTVSEILGNNADICEKGRALKLVEIRPV